MESTGNIGGACEGKHLFRRAMDDVGSGSPKILPPRPPLPLPPIDCRKEEKDVIRNRDIDTKQITKMGSSVGDLVTPRMPPRARMLMRNHSPGHWSPRPPRSQSKYRNTVKSLLVRNNLQHLGTPTELLQKYQGYEKELISRLESYAQQDEDDNKEFDVSARRKATPSIVRRVQNRRLSASPGSWSPRPAASQRYYERRVRTILNRQCNDLDVGTTTAELLRDYQGNEDDLVISLNRDRDEASATKGAGTALPTLFSID